MMAFKYKNVIVFGPTGAVGSHVAQAAHRRGVNVWLAMRDTTKAIPGLSQAEERTGNYHRIQADLSDAASVFKAISNSKAKAAFVYVAHVDISAAFAAMKKAGIEYVVLLSSFTIASDADLRKIPASDFIPHHHARAELILEELKIPHTALRPGRFASNGIKMFLDKSQIPYRALVPKADGLNDRIVPKDIGLVGGAVLVDRPSAGLKEIVYLFGPKLASADETASTIGKVTGREITILHPTLEQFVEHLGRMGMPPAIAKYLYETEMAGGTEYGGHGFYEQGRDNIKKYSGYEPTTFEEFLRTQAL